MVFKTLKQKKNMGNSMIMSKQIREELLIREK